MPPTFQPSTPSVPADTHTGLPLLRTWRAVYLTVVSIFFLWITLLTILTRLFS